MGWHGGEWIPNTRCEDAPCCGCCGFGSEDYEPETDWDGRDAGMRGDYGDDDWDEWCETCDEPVNLNTGNCKCK